MIIITGYSIFKLNFRAELLFNLAALQIDTSIMNKDFFTYTMI